MSQPRRRRATLMTCGVTHFLHDGFSDSLYVLLPILSGEFGLSLTQVGLLKTVYSGSLSASQIPSGLLAERIGEPALLAIGTAVAGLAFVLFGTAGGFAALCALFLMAGLASGTQHPLCSALVARAFDPSVRRTALGTYNFSGDLGKVAFPALVAAGAAAIGWRTASAALGAFALVGAIGIFVALRRYAMVAPASAPDAAARRRGWGIHNRRGFSVLSAIFMIDSATRLAFLTFMPFLLVAKGAEVDTVGLALALLFAGGAAGKFLCGALADRVGIIRTVVLTEILTGVGIMALLALPLATILMVLPVLGLALNGTSSVLYGTVTDFVAADRQARAFGLFYTLGLGAAAGAPLVFGVLSDLAGVPTTLVTVGAMALATVGLCPLLSTSLHRPARRAT